MSSFYNRVIWSILSWSRHIQQSNLYSHFMSELLGTTVLLFFGIASHSSAAIGESMGESSGKSSFTAGVAFGFGALVALSFTLDRSGGHLNPAVSLAAATAGKLCWKRLFYYLVAQYLGGFLASFLVYSMYYAPIRSMTNKTRTRNDPWRLFPTNPAKTTTLFSGFIDQVIGTGLLTFSIQCVEYSGLDRKFLPGAVAAFLTGVVMTNIHNCGCVLNPARDFSPRLFAYLIFGSEVWRPLNGHYWWVVGIIAPHVGGIVGVWTYILLVDVNIIKPQTGGEMSIKSPMMKKMSAKKSLDEMSPKAMRSKSKSRSAASVTSDIYAKSNVSQA